MKPHCYFSGGDRGSERPQYTDRENVCAVRNHPAPAGHASLAGVEYRDVHAIDRPDLRKTFKSFSRMRAWFEEHAAGAKGRTR